MSEIVRFLTKVSILMSSQQTGEVEQGARWLLSDPPASETPPKGRQVKARARLGVRTNLKAGRYYIRLKFGDPSWRPKHGIGLQVLTES